MLVYKKKSFSESPKLFNDMVYSVSELISFLNVGLKKFRVKVVGEVSHVKVVDSGHVYFSLKDEKDSSLLNCIIWRSNYGLFNIILEEGMKVIIVGNSEIYAPMGKFSFIADTIELVGEGVLKKEYEKLKAKLTAEGVFEEIRKRPIPKYIRKIGVVTSLRSGVVIADFSRNLGKFGFKVVMMDSRVEGQEAVRQLLAAIKTFQKKDIEVLVIMRGGGSFESMAAFNNEKIVQAVVDFSVPVIAAIGHDVDVPLVAFAADCAVSTPTAAANFLSESWEELLRLLERHERNIFNKYSDILNDTNLLLDDSTDIIRRAGSLINERHKKIFNQLMVSVQNFAITLQNIGNNINNSFNRIFSALELQINKIDRQLQYAEKLVLSNNPERQLRLGYSIAVCGGKVVRSVKDAKVGSDITLKVSDGNIISEVKNISKK